MLDLIGLELESGDRICTAAREENPGRGRWSGEAVSIDLQVCVRATTHMKGTDIGNQAIRQDAGVIPRRVQGKGTCHACHYVVSDSRVRG